MTTAAATVLTLQELRDAAAALERAAVAAGRITEGGLDAHRPGLPEASELDPQAWLRYYGWLAVQLAEPAKTARRPLPQVLHEALNDEPVPVALRSGVQVAVHPKSLDTLLWLEGLDADVEQCLDELRELVDAEAADAATPAQARFLAALLKGLALRLFVWTLTHPGVGRPFTEEERDPEPPDWTAALHAEDVEALFRAHLQVNHDDLEFLAQAFPSGRRPDATRLPLSGFLGAMAHEWGLSAKVVMRQWSLRGLYAQAITAAQTQREAMAAADRGRSA